MAFEWWQIVIGMLSLLGVGKLLELAYKARRDRRKIKEDLGIANAGKAIDQDVNAFNAIYKRLEIVEARLDSVQIELTKEKVENAERKVENAHRKEDNDRQEKEIERQRAKIHELAGDIQARDLRIIKLEQELKLREDEIGGLRADVDRLSRQIEKLGPVT